MSQSDATSVTLSHLFSSARPCYISSLLSTSVVFPMLRVTGVRSVIGVLPVQARVALKSLEGLLGDNDPACPQGSYK